jgi:hypothetical protein
MNSVLKNHSGLFDWRMDQPVQIMTHNRTGAVELLPADPEITLHCIALHVRQHLFALTQLTDWKSQENDVRIRFQAYSHSANKGGLCMSAIHCIAPVGRAGIRNGSINTETFKIMPLPSPFEKTLFPSAQF